MSGPTKQNRISSSTTAQPPMARLLCRKSSRSRFLPPVLVVTSPPSGVVPGEPAAVTLSDRMTDPGVENAVSNVRGEIADNGRHADDQSRAEHHREVVGQCRLPEQQSHTGEVEDRLRYYRAGHDVRQ